MAALLTDRFRVVLAENFRNRVVLGEEADPGDGIDPINLWLFFARSNDWGGGLPPDPTDNQDAAFDIYDQMLGLKKISASDIRGVIRNNTWKSGTIYDIYRHDYGTEVTQNQYISGLSSEIKLYETNFYVVTSEFKVYKCLNNNNATASTEEPSSTSSAPFTTTDGYVWKYMYSVTASDFEKFKTDDYVPIPLQSVPGNEILPANNFGGGIYNVVISAAGDGYEVNDVFDIIGDGQNAQFEVTSIAENGAIKSVRIINPGQGYTFGTATPSPTGQTPDGSNATFFPIISPKEGLANAINVELGSYRLGLNAKIESEDFPFQNDFSVVGIIYNPIVTTASSVAIGTKKMQLSAALPSVPNPDTIITQSSSGASGKLIQYEITDDAVPEYFIYYTQENIQGEGLNSAGQKIPFVAEEAIDIVNGGSTISGSIAADGLTDPEIVRGSGEIIYIDNRSPITRSTDQTEDFKIILEF